MGRSYTYHVIGVGEEREGQIVTAVNHFDEMVEALKAALPALEFAAGNESALDETGDKDKEILDQARALLAKVKEG